MIIRSKNANAILEKGGCILIKDSDVEKNMIKIAYDLFQRINLRWRE